MGFFSRSSKRSSKHGHSHGGSGSRSHSHPNFGDPYSRSTHGSSQPGHGGNNGYGSGAYGETPRRIETVSSDRSGQYYSGEPEDVGYPAFTRTNSFYRTGADQEEYRHLQASDVRRQVQEAPRRGTVTGSIYPRKYHNNPPQPLSARSPYSEYPITASRQDGSSSGNYISGRPGPVRAFYNDGRRDEFDVGYHDSSRAPMGPRNGRDYANSPYTLGTYYPGPEYTDTSKFRGGYGY